MRSDWVDEERRAGRARWGGAGGRPQHWGTVQKALEKLRKAWVRKRTENSGIMFDSAQDLACAAIGRTRSGARRRRAGGRWRATPAVGHRAEGAGEATEGVGAKKNEE